MAWCTVESDPGVFTELVEKCGVRGAEFAELFSLDDDSFAGLAPVFGLVFLFKWTGEKDDRASLPFEAAPEGLFYAKQVVTNACATQAILSILLNVKDPKLDIGQTLRDLKAFSAQLPYDMRGLAIENSEQIRAAHNAFARPEPFVVGDQQPATKDDDVFHFVAYVPFEDGHVYELDGLKGGPIDLGVYGDAGKTWLSVAREAVTARIEKYAATEIKFNLMAVVQDRRLQLDDRYVTATRKSEAAGNDAEATAHLAAEFSDIEVQRAMEQAKRQSWADENVRRHHNYVPLAIDLLKVLAEHRHLPRLVEAARTKQQTRAARRTS